MSGFGRFGRHRKALELLKVSRDGNKDEVLKLLAKGANINAKDNDGSTPLHHASIRGHIELVAALIAKGADIEGKDNHGSTPLHCASLEGHTDVAESLLAKGANVDAKNNHGWTPLHCARRKGHTDVANVLIAGGACYIDAMNNDENSPLDAARHQTNELFIAAQNGNKDWVLKLLANGADVKNKDNNFGWTPLHHASYGGYIDVAEALIGRGADVDGKDNYGRTPLHIPSGRGHIDVAEALIAKGADIDGKDEHGRTPLHYAGDGGHIDVANALIAKGADVNAKDNYGNTPLGAAKSKGNDLVANLLEAAHAKQNALLLLRATKKNQETTLNGFDESKHETVGSGEEAEQKHVQLHKTEELLNAARDGNKDEVLKLLANGADVDAKDNNFGWTPLHHASYKGHIDVAEALIAKGADVDCNDNYRRTPLHCASYGCHIDVAEALLAKGADVNGKDSNGRTPLHLASYGGHIDVAEALISKGADVYGKDSNGRTPLHHASHRGHINVAEALIAKGADVNTKENHGRTPLHCASYGCHIDVAEALLAKGADANAKDSIGNTSLDAAKSKGNDSVANLLEAALAKKNALLLLRVTNQNQETTLTGFDEGKHETVGSGEEAGQKHDKLPNEDGKGEEAGNSNTPTDQVQFKLTDEDLHFLKMGRELVRDGGDIMPAISIEEQSAIRTLATQMVDIERSLESIRELPPSLSDREPEVAEYFFSFTNAFARAFTAAQALSSGAVKCEVDMSLQSLLGGASWVAENCKLPFVGCVSIFSAIILHQQETKKTNTFMAFEEFFRGNSRDQYLVTYRKLAETFCLQLDISLLNGDNPGKAGRLMEQVKNKIVAPIQKHLRKIHLDTILELSPVEAKAMADLASLTKEVLRLHQYEHRTYDELRTSNERVKASYFVEHIFGKVLIPSSPEQKPLVGTTHSNSLEPSANGSHSRIIEDEARLQHLWEKVQSLEEHSHAKGQEIQYLRAQLRKLADKVKSKKDLTVPSGNQAQAQMIPSKTKGDVQQIWQDFNAAQIEQDIRQLQIQLEKQSQALERVAFENFINNRVLSFHEAFEFTQKILSMAHAKEGNKIEVSEDGWFVLHGKNHCIGTVCKGRLLSKKRTLWKGKVGIKLEEEHRGVKSIMDWFDETKLRPLYERNKKQAIRIMFADELDVEPVLPVMAQPKAQHDRDELFDTDIGPNLR